MNLTGKIVEIFDTNQIKETFKKREFVVEYADNPTYPELIKMEFIQDKCSLLDGYAVGDDVSIEFNLKGRKWTDKNGKDVYFNTIQAWRIEKSESGNTSQGTSATPAPAEEPEWLKSNDETDDLPF